MSDPVADVDFTTAEFARLLRRLPPHLPISDEFEQRRCDGRPSRWDSQRTHMTSWFEAQSTQGDGAYTRETPNTSARRAYGRLQCPEAMVWIAEALGAEPALVHEAVEAMESADDRRVRSRLFRQFVPWTLVAELATKRMIDLPPAPRGRRFRPITPPRRAARNH